MKMVNQMKMSKALSVLRFLRSVTYSNAFRSLTALLLTATACNPVEIVKGRGEVISETRPVGTFREVEAGGDVIVYLTQGPAQPIRVEGQDNILEVLETFVRNDELVIRFKPGVILRRHDQVRVYVTNPELSAVRISGSSEALGQTNWSVDDFRAFVSGSGKVDMTLLDAEDVDTDISGSGVIYLKGNALTNDVHISGSGNVRAFDLVSKEASVNISGSGNCELMVQQKLTARISGSGNVRYKGNPSVDSRITGSGRVMHMD